jgi:hypothetical protein
METGSEQDVQAATSPEEAREIVQRPSEPTSELASIANREVLQRPVPFPFLPTPRQCTPTLGFLGIRAPRIARSRAKPQQTDSDSFAGDRESQNPVAPTPHSVRSAREPEASHFELAASLPRPPIVIPQPGVHRAQLGGRAPDPGCEPGCESMPRASTDSRLRAANFFSREEGPRAPEGGRKASRARTQLPRLRQPPAESIPTPRDVSPPRVPAHASTLPTALIPTPFPRFPPASQSFPSAPPSHCPAHSVVSPRRDPPREVLAPASPRLIPTPPRITEAFPRAQKTPFATESKASKRICTHPEAVRIPTAAQQRTPQQPADEVAPVATSPERIPGASRQVQDARSAVPAARRHRRAKPARALRTPTAPHVPQSRAESHASRRSPRRASIAVYKDKDKYAIDDLAPEPVPSPRVRCEPLRLPRSTPASLGVDRGPLDQVGNDYSGIPCDQEPVQRAHRAVAAGRQARRYTLQRERSSDRAAFAHASADCTHGSKHDQHPLTRLKGPLRRARYRRRRLKSPSAT